MHICMTFLRLMNGIVIGSLTCCISRSPQEASSAARTVGIVLQFFTGMHAYLPAYLQQIRRVPSVTYAAQAVRGVMIENAVLSDKFLLMTILAVSAIILYVTEVILHKRWVEKEQIHLQTTVCIHPEHSRL